MLQALQTRPSRRAYVFAVLAALLWLGGFAALIWTRAGTDMQTLLANLATSQIIIGAGALLAPVFFFFLAAMLAVRSH